jgi:hypothetical protein
MSTLIYTTDALAPAETTAKAAAARKPFWRSMYDAMIASRQRRAEREIAAYIEGHGGLLTDDMEREIMRRVSGRSGNLAN